MATVNPNRDPQRIKKTIREAETAAFTTQLFYFTMKTLFCYVLYQYDNTLKTNWLNIAAYCLLLASNTCLIMVTGRDPGYEPSQEHISIEGQQSERGGFIHDQNMYCDICQCRKKIRTKHCFRCGRCVRKFDHHCPWVGACVGQSNHCLFCLMIFMQSIQAIASFLICFTSMQMYEYKQDSDSYSPEFGVFAIFSLFMFFYILFVGGMFCFHFYLILVNSTTNELMTRSKVKYLSGLKGNPFHKGIFNNISMAMKIPPEGHEWLINLSSMETNSKHWTSKICQNQYYDCC